jgi:crotonobetainyl-CoA:carnitine CoA-transferase CaiB-like acyl-CoA transferase
MGPLAGLRVLDLSRVLAGPLAAQMLADLGADVVKVERPGVGDDTRTWAPPTRLDAQGRDTGRSTYFDAANRGKRSVAADLSTDAGAALVQRLADRADVLIENYKVGSLARRGLDFATLAARNARLVYCSITGWGQTGPYADRPGYDPIAQAYGGLMSVTGAPDDAPGSEPLRCGISVVDVLAAYNAVAAINAALVHRGASGRGQHIDLGLLDVQMAALTNVAQGWLGAGHVPKRMGSAHPSVVPSQVFAAGDGALMMVTAGNDAQFRALCEVAGRTDLLDDARFATNPQRVAHRAEVVRAIRAVLATRPRAWWVEQLAAAGVPCGPVNSVPEAFTDPQVVARGMRIEVAEPGGEPVAMVASPLRFSATPVEYHRAPPRLGEHTDEVIAEWLG